MTTGPFEQRNAYKGVPLRPWIQLRLKARDGTIHELELLADTGNPFAIIIDEVNMAQLKQGGAPDVTTNFGTLTGGWLHVNMPELGLDQLLVGYSSDPVASATQASSFDFKGLVGLPLLRMIEYGGDADWFWIRPAQKTP